MKFNDNVVDFARGCGKLNSLNSHFSGICLSGTDLNSAILHCLHTTNWLFSLLKKFLA